MATTTQQTQHRYTVTAHYPTFDSQRIAIYHTEIQTAIAITCFMPTATNILASVLEVLAPYDHQHFTVEAFTLQ